MPSIWANFDHVFKLFQCLFSAFLLQRNDVLGTGLDLYVIFDKSIEILK